MCGIFLYISPQPYDESLLKNKVLNVLIEQSDNTQVVEYSYDDYYSYFMFHRLAINDNNNIQSTI